MFQSLEITFMSQHSFSLLQNCHTLARHRMAVNVCDANVAEKNFMNSNEGLFYFFHIFSFSWHFTHWMFSLKLQVHLMPVLA